MICSSMNLLLAISGPSFLKCIRPFRKVYARLVFRSDGHLSDRFVTLLLMNAHASVTLYTVVLTPSAQPPAR